MKLVCNALVLGMGASGEAAARLLLRDGSSLTCVDRHDTPRLRERAAFWRAQGVKVHLGCTTLPHAGFDLAVVSPGVARHDPWLIALRQTDALILSELELGWSRRNCPVIAVTGSNGKSTVVKLITHILNMSGMLARPTGNYGPPISGEVDHEADWLVVEVSSFQLEQVHAFRPEVGVLLNVQPNHLDRHGTMDRYRALKARLFQRMAGDDLCLVHEDECDAVKAFSRGRGDWRSFGISSGADCRYAAGWVERAGRPWVDIRRTYFDNPVLGPAAAAAIAAVEYTGVEPLQAARLLESFHPLPHRMQTVHQAREITFIDDSKATSLTAMLAGLQMAPGPIRLIAGGMAKETDFELAAEGLAAHASRVYLIGRDAASMYQAWNQQIGCVMAGTLEEAVRQSIADAAAGDSILLSPGCASFDQFASYSDRGNRFAQLARTLCRPGPDQESHPKSMDNAAASVTIRNPVFT